MRMTCPGCERPTYYPRRVGNDRVRAKNLPAGTLIAVVSDGSCATCRRAATGKTRLLTKGTTIKRELVYRSHMTDAEVQRARDQLVKLWTARRRRGVPPDGLSLGTLQRSGLSLIEA